METRLLGLASNANHTLGTENANEICGQGNEIQPIAWIERPESGRERYLTNFWNLLLLAGASVD